MVHKMAFDERILILNLGPNVCKSHEGSIFKALRAVAVVVYRKALITKKMEPSWLSRRGKILCKKDEYWIPPMVNSRC